MPAGKSVIKPRQSYDCTVLIVQITWPSDSSSNSHLPSELYCPDSGKWVILRKKTLLVVNDNSIDNTLAVRIFAVESQLIRKRLIAGNYLLVP